MNPSFDNPKPFFKLLQLMSFFFEFFDVSDLNSGRVSGFVELDCESDEDEEGEDLEGSCGILNGAMILSIAFPIDVDNLEFEAFGFNFGVGEGSARDAAAPAADLTGVDRGDDLHISSIVFGFVELDTSGRAGIFFSKFELAFETFGLGGLGVFSDFRDGDGDGAREGSVDGAGEAWAEFCRVSSNLFKTSSRQSKTS